MTYIVDDRCLPETTQPRHVAVDRAALKIMLIGLALIALSFSLGYHTAAREADAARAAAESARK